MKIHNVGAHAPRLALVLASVTGATQTVHVVDSAGGGAYVTIQAAIDAAADGDILLVKSGDYREDCDIIGKGLTLQADPLAPGQETFLCSLSVTGVPASEDAAIRGFTLGPHPDAGCVQRTTLALSSSLGSIRVEDVTFRAREDIGIGILIATTVDGISITNCASVVLSRVQLTIATARSVVTSADVARIEARDSNVYLFDSVIDAKSTDHLFGQEAGNSGAPGIRVEGGLLGCYESYVRGGTGISSPSGHGCPGVGPGGPAIDMIDGTLELHASTLVGGAGGATIAGCPIGASGSQIALLNSSQRTLASEARTHVVTSPVREGESIDVAITGKPGDLVWGLVGMEPGAALVRSTFDVPLLLGLPVQSIFLGSLPGSGAANFAFPLGELGPGVLGTTAHVQASFRDASTGRFVLSEPSVITLLDASL